MVGVLAFSSSQQTLALEWKLSFHMSTALRILMCHRRTLYSYKERKSRVIWNEGEVDMAYSII